MWSTCRIVIARPSLGIKLRVAFSFRGSQIVLAQAIAGGQCTLNQSLNKTLHAQLAQRAPGGAGLEAKGAGVFARFLSRRRTW